MRRREWLYRAEADFIQNVTRRRARDKRREGEKPDKVTIDKNHDSHILIVTNIANQNIGLIVKITILLTLSTLVYNEVVIIDRQIILTD